MRAQTQDEAERVAYQNVLAEAERHMNARPPVRCGTCAHFHQFSVDDRWEMVDLLPEGTRNRMYVCKSICDQMGVCDLRLDSKVGGFVFAREFSDCDESEGWEPR